MVDESDSDQDAPETEVIDPLAPPEDWNSPKGSRNGWWRSIGAIVLCVCLTIGISIWSFGQYWPISDDKPYFSDRNENVRMEVLIPHGWTTQYTYPYSLTPQLTIDFVGETQLSPGNTPQSDPTGLTISHFYASNELSDMSFTDSDVQRDGQSKKELRTAGRRLAQINNPKVSVDSIDGRKATAFDYALSSPSGVHQCTERQVEV
ncbi:MAG: hypothetical protein Q4C87_11880, partial [Actinomycetaceae bacterium]|nr:hypothetical protein [Actinomycetaceae bacterium]